MFKYKKYDPLPNYNHYDIAVNGKVIGFISFKNDDFINLEKCPKCGRENYTPNVTSGICTWCEFDANDKNLMIKE